MLALSSFDNRLVAFVVLVLLLLAAQVGAWLSLRFPPDSSEEAKSEFGIAQAAIFGLVGLLLGFSFSLALTRFDARRDVVLREANAISTTLLRCDLLEPGTGRALRERLKDYVGVRLAYAGAGADREKRRQIETQSDRLQGQIWSLGAGAAVRDPRSTAVPLFIASLNETIDLSAEQKAALDATIPDRVLQAVIVIVMAATGLLGYGYGRTRHRGVEIMLSVMFALVLAVIIDLDNPQGGAIRVSLEPLQSVQRSFDHSP